MPNSHDDGPGPGFNVESLIELATLSIAQGDDYATYRQRMAVQLPAVIPRQSDDLDDAADRARLAVMLARMVWKHCPHPAHRYAAAPLPVPERNAPCHCGSGRKFKQCCQPMEAGLPAEPMNYLLVLIDQLPKSRWHELAGSRVSVDMVIDLAIQWQGEKRDADSIALLEPWFKDDRHFSERYEPLIDLLLTAYSNVYDVRRKTVLLDRAMALGDKAVRGNALQRRASMAADAGDYRAAWVLFQQAQRMHPDSPSLSHLEVTLLLSEGREAEARDRARFWVARLARNPDSKLDGLRGFLVSVAEQGQGALLEFAAAMDPNVDAFKDSLRDAPPVACQYLLDPQDGSAGPLTPRPRLERALTQWRDCFERPDDPLDLDDLDDLNGLDGLDLDPDDVDGWALAGEWLPLLQRHPELWNSFEALEDIVAALHDLPFADVGQRLAVSVVARGEALLREVLRANDAEGMRLEWSWEQNRSALQLLIDRIVPDMAGESDDATVACMEWLVNTLNPHDNQGFRMQLMRIYLQRGRLNDALALSDRHPDDFASMRYNRALALFGAGRENEAAVALRAAVEESPKLLKYLLATEPKPVKSVGWGVRVGGNDEAWLYRQEHLALWQRHDALAWAKRTVDKRRTRKG
jgi:tetratricopeptide (TPR) repeat protein